MKHILNFHDAMSLMFLGLIVVSYLIALANDRIRQHSEKWYQVNHPVNPLQNRPWYVRFYEFLNS